MLWGDIGVAAAVAVVAASTAALPLIGNPYFYFADDFQTFFLPMFQEIARQLKGGYFPVMTDRTWYGGAILAEYQFAVFNPISLGLYALIDQFERLDRAATTYALFHVSLLAAGVFTLCRGLGIRRPEAAVAALVGSTSMWVIYWGAQTWICALVGIAWLPWALFLLLLAYRDTRLVTPAALVTALALVSGWPYTIVALMVVVVVSTVITLMFHGNGWRCLRVALALGLALALSAPAILPLWYYLSQSSRFEVGLHSVFQADVDTLIAVGLPIFPDTWRVFSARLRTVSSPPMHYVSWFVPLVLVNADWKGLRHKHWAPGLILVLVAVTFGVLSMFGAGWHFRMPFRLLPYYHIALAILAAWLITNVQNGQPKIWKIGRTAVALILPFSVAFFNVTSVDVRQVALLLCIAALAFCASGCKGRHLNTGYSRQPSAISLSSLI